MEQKQPGGSQGQLARAGRRVASPNLPSGAQCRRGWQGSGAGITTGLRLAGGAPRPVGLWHAAHRDGVQAENPQRAKPLQQQLGSVRLSLWVATLKCHPVFRALTTHSCLEPHCDVFLLNSPRRLDSSNKPPWSSMHLRRPTLLSDLRKHKDLSNLLGSLPCSLAAVPVTHAGRLCHRLRGQPSDPWPDGRCSALCAPCCWGFAPRALLRLHTSASDMQAEAGKHSEKLVKSRSPLLLMSYMTCT